MSSAESSTVRGLRLLLNKRQAAKIRDVSCPETLHLTFAEGREWYTRGTDAGLYTVGFGSGGGLYLSRILNVGTIQANAKSATDVEVLHDWDDLPSQLRSIPEQYRGGGDD